MRRAKRHAYSELASHHDGAVLYKIGTVFIERRTLANNPATIAFTLYDCDITMRAATLLLNKGFPFLYAQYNLRLNIVDIRVHNRYKNLF